ncbi:ATP-binding protein [Streptomyces sp. NPDC020742]|uniref:ATP-binding protein n=1 Tax=unclassified Streptomyces TaxID=2593676 RepID=UPI0033EE5ADC
MTPHQAESVHDDLREEAREETWWLPDPDGFAACALSGSTRTVSDARTFTWATLRSWQLCAGVAEDAALVVSELVSNALRYGSPAAEGDGGPRPAGALARFCPAWLALTRQDRSVLCAVSDAGTTTPVMRPQDPLAESGRGLHIVDRLSEAWGWTQPDQAGKTVWATVPVRG